MQVNTNNTIKMKAGRIYVPCITVLCVLWLMSACNHTAGPIRTSIAQPCDTGIATGDLLFVALPWNYSIYDSAEGVNAKMNAIADSNNVNYIHVAILETAADSIWVIDATIKHGVDRYPLDTFLSDFTLPNGGYPLFRVMRLAHNSCAAHCVEQAKQYIGRAYDTEFDVNNEALYCSELVYKAYVDGQGKHWFNLCPISFQHDNADVPLYWQELFALINKPVPHGNMGILPGAMVHESCLKPVAAHIER